MHAERSVDVFGYRVVHLLGTADVLLSAPLRVAPHRAVLRADESWFVSRLSRHPHDRRAGYYRRPVLAVGEKSALDHCGPAPKATFELHTAHARTLIGANYCTLV